MFHCFVCLNSAFCFLCSVQEDGSLCRMINCLFYVSNAEQWKVFVFFLFLTFKNQELVFFVTVLLTMCPYSSHSSLYHCSVVMTPTFIFLLYRFLQFVEN